MNSKQSTNSKIFDPYKDTTPTPILRDEHSEIHAKNGFKYFTALKSFEEINRKKLKMYKKNRRQNESQVDMAESMPRRKSKGNLSTKLKICKCVYGVFWLILKIM